MQIDVHENQVVGQTVHNSTLSASAAGHASKLAVCIVECIRQNMECHPDNVRSQIAIVIQMAGDNSEKTSEKSNRDRRRSKFFEELREEKADLPIKIKIENSFSLLQFVGGFESGGWLRCLRSH